MRIQDWGQWRPPRGAHRGKGMTLMEGLTDSVEIDGGEEGTTVTLRRRPQEATCRMNSSSVDLQHHDGIPVARLVGEVDLTRAPGIRVGLLRAVTNQDHGLVLDLRDTTYLDSAGVNVIFELAERLSARQQRLAAVVPDRAIIERVLTLVNLRSILESHRTLEEALDSIRALQPDEPPPEA